MNSDGIYPLSEAARLAGIPVATARAWFVGRSDKKGKGPIFQSSYERVENDYAISFLNLIEAYVARFFRNEGVKPAILRRTYKMLQLEMNTKHPFAKANLETDGRAIMRRHANEDLISVIDRQHFFPQMHLARITYDKFTQLALEWAVAKGVIVNPRINYGKPVIENTNISTLIVARQYRANELNAEFVAKLFGLSRASVIAAYEFEHSGGRIAA